MYGFHLWINFEISLLYLCIWEWCCGYGVYSCKVVSFHFYLAILLIDSHTSGCFGDRNFAAAAARVWNSLPSDLWKAYLSYTQTCLFRQSDHSTLWTLLSALCRNILTHLLTVQYYLVVAVTGLDCNYGVIVLNLVVTCGLAVHVTSFRAAWNHCL